MWVGNARRVYWSGARQWAIWSLWGWINRQTNLHGMYPARRETKSQEEGGAAPRFTFSHGRHLCWYFPPWDGAPRGEKCERTHIVIRLTGVRWSIPAQLARCGRRGSRHMISSGRIGGYTQALGEAQAGKIWRNHPTRVPPGGNRKRWLHLRKEMWGWGLKCRHGETAFGFYGNGFGFGRAREGIIRSPLCLR